MKCVAVVFTLLLSALAILIFLVGMVTDLERKKLRERYLRVTCYILIFLVCWTPGKLDLHHMFFKPQ